MKNKELIIFDMDGLLVDTEIHYRNGRVVAAKEEGIDLDKGVVDSWVGKGINYTTDYFDRVTGNEEITKKLEKIEKNIFTNNWNQVK